MIVYIRNPLILCLYLVFIAVILRLIIFSEISVWLFNSLVLIFLGGIIILFLYLSTLSNNLKFYFSLFSFRGFRITLVGLMAILTVGLTGLGPKLELLGYFPSRTEGFSNFSVLFFNIKTPHLAFIITLLLLTLFTVVKLTESFKGSLVKGVRN